MKIESQLLMTEKRRSLRGAWVVILVLLLAAAERRSISFSERGSAPAGRAASIHAPDSRRRRGGADRRHQRLPGRPRYVTPSRP